MRLPHALLLLGPTGSGKTPLGRAMEAQGLWGRRFHHLDFGALLRAGAEGAIHLSRSYRHVVTDAVATGRLLDDDEWIVAEALLDDYLEARDVEAHDVVVLNGVPRHRGQAEDVARSFRVGTVVVLEASAPVVRARIARDPAGDRAGRGDDTAEAVEARLARFQARTRPLVAWYEERGVPIVRLSVDEEAAGEDLRRALETRVPGGPVRGPGNS